MHHRRADRRIDQSDDATREVRLGVALTEVQDRFVVGFGELLVFEALLPVEYCEGVWIQHPDRDVRKRREKGPGFDVLVVRSQCVNPVQRLAFELMVGDDDKEEDVSPIIEMSQ